MSNECDLMATSIDATPTSVKVGQKTKVTVVMANNGPGIIPIGEATCQITISRKWFYRPYNLWFYKTLNFKTFGANQWSLLGVKSDKDFFTIFFQNNAGEIPLTGGPNFGFTFDIKGKNPTPPGTPADITLTSSLSLDAISSDIQGENQFASLKIEVK